MSSLRSLHLALGLLTLSVGSPAFAGEFNVSPTRIDLSDRRRSALVSVQNIGDEPLRFQVFAYRWDQTDESDMELSAASDLLIYPSLVTVLPGESRRVRIGTNRPMTGLEQTWRVFIEELPPLEPDTGIAIRVLTRAAIPVFMAPTRPGPSGQIADVALGNGALDLTVANDGNLHFMIQSVEVLGRDADGRVSYAASARGWYVLAGQERDFSFDLSEATCRATESLEVRAITDAGVWTTEIPISADQCAR